MQKSRSVRAKRVSIRGGRVVALPSTPPEMHPQPKPVERLFWLDNAKALGIIALFYGHIVENIFLNYGSLGYLQYKLIYSFHIPLFFVLSGYIARKPGMSIHSLIPSRSTLRMASSVLFRFLVFMKNKLVSRIVPFLFFNLLLIPAYLMKGYISGNAVSPDRLMKGLVFLAQGIPVFNPMTWFLICLFFVELIHYLLSPVIKDKWGRMLIFMVLFYVAGWVISWQRPAIAGFLHMGDSLWIYEAVMAYSFYLFGRLTFVSNLLDSAKYPYLNVWLLIVFAIVLAATFNLNNGPFYGEDPHGVVVISGGTYGNVLLFPLTALAGSLCVIALSKVVGKNRLLGYLGRNSLILMGLNGLFFKLLNTYFVDQGMRLLYGGEISVVILSAVLTAASILVCMPFVFVLEKYLPQLTGNPKAKGPLLPRLAHD